MARLETGRSRRLSLHHFVIYSRASTAIELKLCGRSAAHDHIANEDALPHFHPAEYYLSNEPTDGIGNVQITGRLDPLHCRSDEQMTRAST